VARLFISVIGFGLIAGIKKETYFAPVQAGMEKNYQPMEKLFAGIIEKSVVSS
jgi:cell filamentation protein